MPDEAVKLELDDSAARVLAKALKLEVLFPEFTAEDFGALFPTSALYAFPAEFPLIEQESVGRDLFVIHSGKVTVFKVLGSAGAPLATLGPGEFLGEIALYTEGLRTASAIVTEDSLIFRISSRDLQAILDTHEELSRHLGALAGKRLEAS